MNFRACERNQSAEVLIWYIYIYMRVRSGKLPIAMGPVGYIFTFW